MTKYLVTGATGQLGRLVLESLKQRTDIANVAVLVRSDKSKEEFEALGYDVRQGDYSDKAVLEMAFAGVDRLLLISSSEIGQRAMQHSNVIEAAKAAGAGYVAYTSLLKASESPMGLAGEHKATEAALAASGLEYTVLRNGWYTENYLMGLPQVLEMGKQFGAAADGRLNSATRKDYADAAAAVLVGTGHEGKTYELGGDEGYSLSEFTAVAAEVSGKEITYVDMPEAAYKEALLGAGLPEPFAALLADSDVGVSKGWLATDSNDLSTLIGRSTEPMATSVKKAIEELAA